MNKGHKIKLLDKGYVKFLDSMGSDESIIEAARMSTGRGFEGWDPHLRCKICDETNITVDCKNGSARDHVMIQKPGDMTLLEFLYSNRHATPFEMGDILIEVYAPLFVFREWHRHRTQSYNEFSARYSQMPNDHYIPELERIVKQSKKNKQGGEGAFERERAAQIIADIERQQIEIYGYYDGWIQDGLANEVARINTPVSRYSKMRAKTNLRNWLGFLLLRMAASAQYEIRVYANAVAEIVQALFPRTYELFEEWSLYAITFSRTEMAALRAFISGSQFDSKITEYGTIPAKYITSMMKKLGAA